MDYRTQYRQSIRQTMSELTARTASDADDLHARMASVTAAAVTMIRGAEMADVMLIDRGHVESLAPTAPLMAELDGIQARLQQGPCLQAAVADAVIRVPDLRSEDRWPAFTTAAVAAGVRSILSFQLFTHEHGIGALNVFGSAAGSFNVDDEAIGAMLATHAAIVLIATQQSIEFQSKLAGRDLIGQAKGILMERFVIDAASAFDLMIARARGSNTPVHLVAHDIVTTV